MAMKKRKTGRKKTGRPRSPGKKRSPRTAKKRPARKASTRASQTRTAQRSRTRKKSTPRGKAVGKGASRKPEKITIWYDRGIQCDKHLAKAYKKEKVGVVWEAKGDYDYEVVFDKDGSPFVADRFRNIYKGSPQESGPPEKGVATYSYDYRINCINTGETLDPTIKVDY